MQVPCNIADMKSVTQINILKLRASGGLEAREWVVHEVENGYTVSCGDATLYTVNSKKPRLFKRLDSVLKALRAEIGITEFRIVAMKIAA